MNEASRDMKSTQDSINKLKAQLKTNTEEYEKVVLKESQDFASSSMKDMWKDGKSTWVKEKFSEAKSLSWDIALKKMAAKTFNSPYIDNDPEKGLANPILAKHEQELQERGEKDVTFGTDKSREGLSEKNEKAMRAKFNNAASASKRSMDATFRSILAGQGMGGVGASKAMGLVNKLMKDQKKQNETKIEARDYQAKQQGLGEAAHKYKFETQQKEIAQDDLGEFRDSQRRYAIDQAAGKRQFGDSLDVFNLEQNMNAANMTFGGGFTSEQAYESNMALKGHTSVMGKDSEGNNVVVAIKDKDGNEIWTLEEGKKHAASKEKK